MTEYHEKPKRGSGDYPLATISNRFVALIIDSLLVAIVGSFIGLFLGDGFMGFGGGFLAGLGYQWYFLTKNNGQTPGKQLMNIRAVKLNGEPFTFADVLVRFVGYYINSAVFMIGWIWALFDERSQGWHDKLVSTLVVQAGEEH